MLSTTMQWNSVRSRLTACIAAILLAFIVGLVSAVAHAGNSAAFTNWSVSDKNSVGKNEVVGFATGTVSHSPGYCSGTGCYNTAGANVTAVTNYGKGIHIYLSGTHQSMGWTNLAGGSGYWKTITYADSSKGSANVTGRNVRVGVSLSVKVHAGWNNWGLKSSIKVCKDKAWAVNPCSSSITV